MTTRSPRRISGGPLTRPLLKIAFLFIPGLCFGYSYHDALPAWFIFALLTVFITAVFVCAFKVETLEVLLVCAVILISGALYGSHHRNLHRHHLLTDLARRETEIAFTARIIDDAHPDETNRSRLAVVERFTVDGKFIKNKGKVWLRLKGGKNPSSGARITGIGALHPLPSPQNPGAFDFEAYSRRLGVRAILKVEPADWEFAPASSHSIKQIIIVPLRRSVCETIDEYIGGTEGEILKALTLGLRAGLDEEFKGDLRRSGMWHLLSLSGLHLGIFAGIALILFTLLRLPGDWRWGLAVIAVVLYCIIAEMRPPMLRAAVIIVLLFGSRYLNRYLDRWNLLALSALIILLINPAELFSPGFHLSYAAVVFILAALDHWGESLASVLKPAGRMIKYSAGLLAASIAATLGSAPFLAYHFGGVPLASIPAGLIGIPLTGVILAVFPLFYLTALVYSSLAAILGNALWAGASFLTALVEISAASGLYIHTLDFSIFHLTLLIIPLLLLVLRRRQWLWAALLTASILVWESVLEPAECRIVFLDVGQGNSAVVELPDGKCLLIDAGPADFRFNAGEKIVAPYLRRRGIDEIDHLILSHPDKDHTGGAGSITEEFDISALDITSAGPFLNGEWATLERRAGNWLKIGGALLLFFNPISSSDDDNEMSIVFALLYGESKVIFPGDIPAKIERKLTAYDDLLKADILLVPHHGSRQSSSTEFLNTVSPRWAVVSSGKRNIYRHPAPETLERLKRAGAEIHRTDLEGAAVFKLSRNNTERIDWRRK